MTGLTLEVEFATAASERRFCSPSLPDARDRYEASDYRKQGWFWAYSQFGEADIDLDGGLVRPVFDGSPAALLAVEADRWECVEGLTGWTVRRYDEEGYDSLRAQQVDAKGAVGGEWKHRYKPLTAAFAPTVQMGYHWHEETDAYLRGIENRIKPVAAHCGEQPARTEFDRFESELDEWLEANEPGTATL